METSYFLELADPPGSELRQLLLSRGARLESALTGWAIRSAADWEIIERRLREEEVEFDLFYEFAATPDDDVEDLVAYLALAPLDSVEKIDPMQLILLRDEMTSSTVASESLVELLKSATQRLHWQPVDEHKGLLRLVQAPALPDPVVVPHAIFLSEGTSGLWAVQSDGRELLTSASRRLVKETGAALAPECSVEGRVLHWRRPLLFSGRVLALLEEHKVEGPTGTRSFLGAVAA
ncbi:MAG: hypothetical protein ACREMZ_16300 [Gemmatimonadales bacterium]